MENKISFFCVISLKEMAMRRLAIVLWNQPDMLTSIVNFTKVKPDCANDLNKWSETVENKVIDKLSKLVIPKTLSKQMMHIIKLVGLQIPKWKTFHERYLEVPGSDITLGKYTSELKEKYLHLFVGFGASVLEKLCWTNAGRIDYRQTAIELLRHEMLDTEKRYRLACYYCLEDCIPLLWEELPFRIKRKYYFGGRLIYELVSEELPYYWPYVLTGGQARLEGMIGRRSGPRSSFKHNALLNSMEKCNKYALEYFFQKLSDEDKNVSFLTLREIELFSTGYSRINLPHEQAGDVMSFLLSKMDYERQMEVIRYSPVAVWGSFLYWPNQDVFLKMSDMFWGLISTEAQYRDLLHRIGVLFLYSNYSYPSFFREFFIRSPVEFRKSFVNFESHWGNFFDTFFEYQDSETIEVVLRSLDSEDRVKLVSSENFFELYQNYILNERWHMVQACLREASLTQGDRERVKWDFMRFLTRTDGGRMEKSSPVWMRFLQILDETNESSKRKRSLEDDTQSEAKKLSSKE